MWYPLYIETFEKETRRNGSDHVYVVPHCECSFGSKQIYKFHAPANNLGKAN